MFDLLKDKFSGDAGRDRLYGLGLLASQLGAGQAPNAAPALEMIKERQQRNALREQMGNSDFLTQFSDQEKAFLSTLPPAAAQELIAQRIFSQPAPIEGTEINGQLVNPITGEVMGDFRTPETPDPVRGTVIDGKLVNPITGEVIADHSGGGSVSYIATGEGAAELGLDPNKSYNVQSGPEGIKATEIGGNGTSVIVNNQGDTVPSVGTIPQGYQLEQVDGAWRMMPIPGGPADTSANEARAADMSETSSDVVANAFSRASEADGQRALTGILGAAAAYNPGSDNAEVYRQVEVLKNIASAESLNAMRQSSPTGGGLGNVTERELDLLARQGGALDPASPNFQRDLQDYTRALLRTIHGVEAGDTIFGQILGGMAGGGNTTSGGVTWSIVE